MAFHARLKELREGLGFTQGELAERAGMSQAGIANLEQDRTKPVWETVQKLATALGVSCEAFNEPAASDEPRGRGRPTKPESPADKPTPEAPTVTPKKRVGKPKKK
jgi:transcriptional regulator with XRE-family HTH domain